METGKNGKFVPAALFTLLFAFAAGASADPRAVILFIGDGMGQAVIEAARMRLTPASSGTAKRLFSFEEPYFASRATVETSAADEPVTDSAAAATAFATGRKVNKGVLSVALPGDGKPLKTALELMKDKGCATGLVSTASITDATPAAFASHRASRRDRAGVASDFLNLTRPDVLMGGGDPDLTPEALAKAGYSVVDGAKALASLDTEKAQRAASLTGTGDMPYIRSRPADAPTLALMTRVALAILDNNPECFFLMVEAGRIDDAAHENDLETAVLEVEELSQAVGEALKWAAGRKNVAIAVTADHETGGLTLPSPYLTPGGEKFLTKGHTASSTPFMAGGDHIPLPGDFFENTRVFDFLTRR